MTGTFEGVGSLQFSPDNKFALACSGEIDVQATTETYLLSDTNSEYLIGHFQCYNSTSSSEQISWDIFFNDVLIIRFFQEGRGSAFRGQGADQNIMIPPFTKVEVKGTNSGASTTVNGTCVFTGKVFGAVEQENLESITNNNKWAKL